MRTDEILDSEDNTVNSPYSEPVKWWEDRRLIYNLFLFGIEIYLMVRYSENTRRYGWGSAIVETLVANIIANVFYSLGWGLEIFLNYYFKKTRFSHSLRLLLFILGLLFSVFLAWEEYSSVLVY